MEQYEQVGYEVGAAMAAKTASKQAGGRLGEAPHQSEIERGLRKLLDTAEELDATVEKLVGRIEKVTRTPHPVGGPAGDGKLNACPATILGRDLDGLNDRIRSSMNILQSTIQRIEL